MVEASAEAPTSTELTVTSAADVLSRNFHDEASPADSRSQPIVKAVETEVPALSDDTKIALKDGSKVSVKELKRGYISRKTFTAKTQALADERARFEELRTQTQHHAIALNDKQRALETFASYMLPQQPDPSLIDADPQAFKIQQATFELFRDLALQMQHAAQAEFEAAQSVREAEQRDVIQRRSQAKQQQRERLFEVMPEMADANTARQFEQDAIKMMADYGFSAEELDSGLHEWRNYRIVRDLLKYRKAVSAKPDAISKISSVPVLSGKRRMERSARSERTERTDLERFRNSGRMDDAAAILAKRMREHT